MQVDRRSGVSELRIFAGQTWPADARLVRALPGEWFAVVERPVDPESFCRYGIARVFEDGSRQVRWHLQAAGLPSMRVFAAVANSQSSDWREESHAA